MINMTSLMQTLEVLKIKPSVAESDGNVSVTFDTNSKNKKNVSVTFVFTKHGRIIEIQGDE